MTIVAKAAKTVRDPVCRMQVDPLTTTHHADHHGKDYHFCSSKCQQKFTANPDDFEAIDAVSPPAAPEGAIWIYPMHPQIQQEGPGACPICGMALEPVAGQKAKLGGSLPSNDLIALVAYKAIK
jgi:P-type Cu+ transporter